MKIEIDTNKDSHEDIKKAIKMLQALIGQQNNTHDDYNSYESKKQPDTSPGAFNMFGDDTPIMGSKDTYDSYEDKKEEPPKKEPKIQIIEY